LTIGESSSDEYLESNPISAQIKGESPHLTECIAEFDDGEVNLLWEETQVTFDHAQSLVNLTELLQKPEYSLSRLEREVDHHILEL
jgi:hypothetical protein